MHNAFGTRRAGRRVASWIVLASLSSACGLSGQGTATGNGDAGRADEGSGSDAEQGMAGEDGGGEGGASAGDSAADSTVEAGDATAEADAGEAASADAQDAAADTQVLDADAGVIDSGEDATVDADAAIPFDAPLEADARADGPTGLPPDARVDGTGACDFNGTWGTRLTIAVSWQPQGLNSIILASGTGQIRQWIKGARTQSGTSTSDATVVCGVELPDFQETALVGGETYGVRFPGSLFDNDAGAPVLPTFTVGATLGGLTPGSTFNTTESAALLGISMNNPLTDPWPSTVTTQVDMDHDNHPGVTINVAQGSPYSNVPTGFPGFPSPPRATKLYLAIRQVTIVSGNVDDCDHMSGTVTIPQISSKYAIDSHVLGCALVDGGDCTSAATPPATSQAAFVDNTQPVFTPSGATDFHSVRLATGATCAEVRAALP
jgi:hypothetical protein